MDVMQKFRERLRRSSSSDVQSICISTIPDKVVGTGSDFAGRQGVIRRYSIPAKARPGQDSKHEGPLYPKQVFEGNKLEYTASSEKQSFLDAYKTLQYEKADTDIRLQNALEKLKERDNTIKELQNVIQQIKEDRLQDEEVRYQRSILAKRQYIDSLEAEIDKMKKKIEQDNIDVEKKVRKAKRKVAQIKQEYALKMFEIQQENASLKERIKELEGTKTLNEGMGKLNARQEQSKARELSDDCKPKHELIVELSEEISSLIQENMTLKEDLQVANEKLLKFTMSKKGS